MTTFNNHGLVSLWDIMEALDASNIIYRIHSILNAGYLGTDDEAHLNPRLKSLLLKEIKELQIECEKLGLLVSIHHTKTAIEFLNVPSSYGEVGMMGRYVNMIVDTIRIEMQARKFFFLNQGSEKYYSNAYNLYGENIIKRFPQILDDVEGAGNCLAFGQGTACVMHLMRVMEVGLKSLSNALGIPYAPSWESHLNQIQSKIALKRDQKDAEWIKKEPFFRDVSGDLISVKQAWRNPTMHIERKYSREVVNSGAAPDFLP